MLITDQVTISLGTALLVAIPNILVGIGTLIQSLRNGRKTSEVKSMVNGRMDELLKVTREDAHKNGREAVLKEMVEQGHVETSSGVVLIRKETSNVGM